MLLRADKTTECWIGTVNPDHFHSSTTRSPCVPEVAINTAHYMVHSHSFVFLSWTHSDEFWLKIHFPALFLSSCNIYICLLHIALVWLILKNGCWELLICEVFNIPQSEEQFYPIRAEGESSQENLPNQEADQDQVDLSATHGETNHSIYQIDLLY